MKATKYTAQRLDGGRQVTFTEVPPAAYRAGIALDSDPGFALLDEQMKGYIRGNAIVMLSAVKRGLGEELCIPKEITAESVEEWAGDTGVALEDFDVPDQPGAEPLVMRNPTEPKE